MRFHSKRFPQKQSVLAFGITFLVSKGSVWTLNLLNASLPASRPA
jgi:hypothetical protein